MKSLYPDNKRGAKEYLHGETTIPHEIIASASFEADPNVPGCWRATLKNYHCKYAIVYGLGSGVADEYDSELSD